MRIRLGDALASPPSQEHCLHLVAPLHPPQLAIDHVTQPVVGFAHDKRVRHDVKEGLGRVEVAWLATGGVLSGRSVDDEGVSTSPGPLDTLLDAVDERARPVRRHA